MIRHIAKTEWFGQHILQLPAHKDRQINCPFPPKYRDKFNELEREMEAKNEARYKEAMDNWHARRQNGPKPIKHGSTYFEMVHQLRTWASFPALVHIGQHLKLNRNKIQDEGWYDDPETSFYYQHLDEIVNSSTKCQEIKKVIQSWPDEPRRHYGKMVKAKGILCSSLPVCTFILWLVGFLKLIV